jgi:hypothetical protein
VELHTAGPAPYRIEVSKESSTTLFTVTRIRLLSEVRWG